MKDPLQEIQHAAEGLLFMSETDAPLTVIRPDEKLMKQLTDPSTEQVTIDHFFRNMVKRYPEMDAGQLQTISRFEALVSLLKHSLTDVKVYRKGNIQVDAYIIGYLPDKKPAGLQTRLVET